MLEMEKAGALSNPAFLNNHYIRQYVVILQIVLTLFIIVISVIKPWRSRNKSKGT